jgi:hypothetical protein
MLPNEKGRARENAVHAIEHVILQFSPTLHDKAFRIEPRKHISVDDVRHEIDIFVTVELAPGYASTFIFECKNWSKAVGKNEVGNFSDKIGAAAAQQGFFVAKSFTKDGEARARLDKRMTLLIATEHDPAATITPESFHFTEMASAKPTLTLRVAGSPGTNIRNIDVQGKHIRMHGQDVLLSEFYTKWIDQLYKDELLHFKTWHLPPGIHPMTATGKQTFGAGECILDDQEMESLQLDVEFGVKTTWPVVTSHYEVATRGRVVQFEAVNVRNLAITAALVATENDDTKHIGVFVKRQKD